MMREKNTLLALALVGLITAAALPYLLRAQNPDLEVRRRRIAGMTQAEREHLLRNLDRFNAMPPAERQQLEAFSAALAEDQVHGRGMLSHTLAIYGDWLRTITPHQREALRKEQDPVKRIASIRNLVEEQRDERIEVRMGERMEFLGPIPLISRSDLEAMCRIIESRLELYITNPQELDGYDGMSRYLKMFELLARERRSVRDLLSDANRRLLLDAIADDQTREQLESIPDNLERPLAVAQARRLKLGLAISQAVEVELDRELRQKRSSRENLAAYFDNLPIEEQDDLLALTPEQFREQLFSQYVENEWSQDRINMRLVRQFFRPQLPPGERGGPGRGAIERPGPGRPPNERPGQPPRRRDPRPGAGNRE